MSVTTDRPIGIRRAGPRIGAEITGVDFTAAVEPTVADQLREAFRDHKVLVFRAQHLTPEQHVEAVRIFGESFDHPTATRHPDHRLVYLYRVDHARAASNWHIGGLWWTPPFQIESLVYDEVAELGGHTLWADLQAAYDYLSEPFKVLLESVSGEYDSDATHYAQGSDKSDVRRTVEHPVVLRHLDTGRPGMFVSTGVRRLTGVTAGESDTLLPYLGWDPGDFVLWDNLATWHHAIDDYGDGARAYRQDDRGPSRGLTGRASSTREFAARYSSHCS